MSRPVIKITVEGGVIQDVLITEGTALVIVRDYDTEGTPDEDTQQDTNGDRYIESRWEK